VEIGRVHAWSNNLAGCFDPDRHHINHHPYHSVVYSVQSTSPVLPANEHHQRSYIIVRIIRTDRQTQHKMRPNVTAAASSVCLSVGHESKLQC